MNDRSNNPFDLISQEIGISLPSAIGFGVQHPYGFQRPPNSMPMDMIPDLPPMPMHNAGIHQIIHGSVPKRGKSGQTRKGDMERIEKRRKREREAAARSRQRKMELINTLEAKVAMMKDEIQQLKLQVIRLGGVPETGTAGLDLASSDTKKIKTLHVPEDHDHHISSSNTSPSSTTKSRK